MAKKGISMNFQRNHSLLLKRIPLHYQKKLINSSNGSFNTTIMTGAYKNKIRALLKNNKTLAIALQNDRFKKEELMEENKANASIILFSRLKLASLSNDLKHVVTVLDETLSLLERHSSVSSTKFTSKNTVSREEFKERVQNRFMDSIPEEPESPQRNSDIANINKKKRGVSPEFHVDILNKRQELSNKPTKSDKTLHPSNLKNSIKKSDEVDRDILNYRKSVEYCFDESNPAEKQIRNFTKQNKNYTSKVIKAKTETKSATGKKCFKVNQKDVSAVPNRVTFVNRENISKSISSSGNNSSQKQLYNDIYIFDDIQLPENDNKKKNENITLAATCVSKNDISPNKLQRNIIENSNFNSDSEKENASPFERPKLLNRKVKSLNIYQKESTITKRSHSRNSALQCLSPNNIEKFKCKRKKIEIDDLITTGRKSTALLLKNKRFESCDSSQSYLEDITLSQQEMIRNLTENTFPAAAEVHNNPDPLKTEKLKVSNAECDLLKQPIVLVKDIFQPGKSFCQSISVPSCNELNEIPLEMQLLEQCSSLKMIPEESNQSQDQAEDGCFKIKSRNDEQTLSIEDDVASERKKSLRRHPHLNYKEPATNIKLRR